MKIDKLIVSIAVSGAAAVALILLLVTQIYSGAKPGTTVAPMASGIDITDRVELLLISSEQSSDHAALRATVRLKNTSDIALLTPMSLVIRELRDPVLKVLNADGLMQDTSPYYDAAAPVLEPGAVSGDIVLELGRADAHRDKGGLRRYLGVLASAAGQKTDVPFEYRVIGQLPVQPLQPRAYPFALEAGSGKVDVAFKVNVVAELRAKPERIELRRLSQDHRGYDSSDELLEKRQDSGLTGIYTTTVSIDTRDYKAGDCIEYQAVTEYGATQLASAPYRLCITGLPAQLAESDTSSQNLLQLPGGGQALADELLVRVAPGTGEAEVSAIAIAVNANVAGSIPPRNLYQFKFDSNLSLSQIQKHIETLRAHNRVESAYLNMVGSFGYVPNDPRFSDQHGLKHVHAHDVWDIGATGEGVVVTVLDSGIKRSHEDFRNADGSCQLVDGCSGNNDSVGHGTLVSGVISAAKDNSKGIAGVAPDSEVESFVLSSDAGITMAEIVAGYQAIAATGTGSVINQSSYIAIAPPGADLPDVADQWDLCASINDVVLNDTTPVALAVVIAGNTEGNGWLYPGKCNDSSHPSHAGLTNKNLFIPVMASCTGGSCPTDTLPYFSSYGNWVDLAAPGVDIVATGVGGQIGDYPTVSGTSFSGPIVAGAAAQLLSCGVLLSQIESLLETSAPVNVAHPGGSAPRIDVHRALEQINDAPTAVVISNSAINENTNTAGGFTVGTLSTTDSDTCDKHVYSIVGGADAGMFSIGAGGNQLLINAGVLNFEQKSSYSVIVRTTDFFSESFNQTLTITVNDLNEAPQIANQAFGIDQNTPNGAPVGTVVASDPDAGDSRSFAITDGNTGNAFVIDNTGLISVNNAAALTQPAFALAVRVTDAGGLNATATVTVNIVEQTGIVIQVLANDTDIDNDTLTVSSITQPAHGFAAITAANTAVRYTPVNGYYGQDTFNYTLSDGQGGSDVGTVIVTVAPGDSDGDGVVNPADQCPNTPAGAPVDANGCAAGQLDADSDGIPDQNDQCPNTQTAYPVNGNGCAAYQLDADADGISDSNDLCSGTPQGEPVDGFGCSDSQLDTDTDGVTNNLDQCPGTPLGESVDTFGCSDSQRDTDGDGVTDNLDVCPGTPDGEAVDGGGCSASQLDGYGDISLSQGWNGPFRVSSPNATAYDVGLSINAEGKAAAIWAQETADRSQVAATYFMPGWEDWNGPAIVHDLANSFTMEKPVVEYDANGDAIAVWYQTDESGTGEIVARRYVAGTGWQSAVTLQAITSPYTIAPLLVVAPSGRAVVVWENFEDGKVWSALYVPANGWANPEPINSGQSYGLAVDIDNSGNVMVVWEEYEDGMDAVSDVMARRYTVGAGWGTPALLEAGLPSDLQTDYPNIEFDSAGNAIAVWQADDGNGTLGLSVYFNLYTPATGWSDAQLLVDEAYEPRLAVKSDGAAAVVWNIVNNELQGALFAPGSGWSSPATIDDASAGSPIFYKDVAVSDSGHVYVVWTQFSGSWNSVWANRYEPGVGWAAATLLETNNSAHAYAPAIVVDSNNNAMAAWNFTSAGFGNQVWTSIFID